MKNNTLFIAATHGNETIGPLVLKQLEASIPNLTWSIGNERAFLSGQRYTEKDLNRCGKGDPNSSIYEMRRAAELIALSTRYQITIDIHGTDSPVGICTLVTNPTKENLRIAAMLETDRIVIWPSITPEMKYAVSEFYSPGFEIECGDQKNIKTAERLCTIISSYLNQSIPDENKALEILHKKQIFMMYGDLRKKDLVEETTFKEFTPTIVGPEAFYPIFVSTYSEYEEVVCYKLRLYSQEELGQIFST